MFNKILSFVMILSVFTVHANATSQSGLKAAYDELNYAITVEWDQKDQDFYRKQMSEFAASVRELQAKGLTNSQMIEFAKSEVKDARVAKDIETAFNMISLNKMSSKEASSYMTETLKKSYTQGASWNGDVFIYLAAGLLVVGLAIALANGNVRTTGNVWGPVCYDDLYCDTYCDFWSCWDNCYYITSCY